MLIAFNHPDKSIGPLLTLSSFGFGQSPYRNTLGDGDHTDILHFDSYMFNMKRYK